VQKAVESMLATQAEAAAAGRKAELVAHTIKHHQLVLQASVLMAAAVQERHCIQAVAAVVLAAQAALVRVQRLVLAEAVERRP